MTNKTIKNEATYDVVLSKSIKVGRATVHPGTNVRLRGDALKEASAADAVVSWSEVS